MDSNDRQAIDGLFSRIAEVERQTGPLDRDANAFIGEKIAAQPSAPYLMAQTIVVQDQALAAAEQRIRELEQQSSSSRSSGGLLSSLFGSKTPAAPPARGPMPAAVQPGSGYAGAAQPNSPWGQQGGQQGAQATGMRGGGGGFLQGAAQTAMGVAGGMLLGSAIGSMFAGDEAQAAEPEAAAEPAAEDFGGDDMGGDMEF